MTTELPPAPSLRRAADPVAVFAVILAMLAVLAINNRIFTYVSGQDPMSYVRAARDILHDGWPAICPSGGGVTAPGHPLILAAAMALFGPTAPYWVNVSLALLLMPLTLLLLTRLGLSPRTAAVALFSSVLILTAGYPMNAAFLLYPFRELPALFFTVLGALLFLTGCDAADQVRRAAFCASAGVCALLTAATREPSVLGFAGVLVWCLVSRSPRMNKAVSLGSFAAPLILAVLGWILLAKGSVPNRQWTYFLAQLGTTGLHSWTYRFSNIEPRMRAWVFEELGLFWAAMAVLGIWALRRQPRALLAFLVPFVLSYAFYGSAEAHRRYLLACLVFAAPVAGYGLGWLIEAAATRMPTSSAALRAMPAAATLVALACSLVPAVAALEPTGPRVKSPQLRAFLDTVAQTLSGNDKILLSPYSRFAGDAILSFTDLRPTDVLRVKHERLSGQPLVLVTTINEQARFRGRYVPYAGPDAPAIVGHFADVAPVLDKEGQPAAFTLGHGRYGILRSQPWQATESHNVVQFDPDPGRAHVVWLDFRQSDPSAVKTVSIVKPADGSDAFVTNVSGCGLQPVFVPAGATGGTAPLRVRASGPIPRDIPVTVQTGDRPAGFPLDEKRSLSIHSWFKEPFKPATFGDKYAAVFDEDGGRIEIPMPAAECDLQVVLSLLVNASARSAQPATFRFMRDGQPVGEMRLGPGQGHWHGLRLERVKAGQVLRIDLRSDTTENETAWRIHRMVIAIQPAATP